MDTRTRKKETKTKKTKRIRTGTGKIKTKNEKKQTKHDPRASPCTFNNITHGIILYKLGKTIESPDFKGLTLDCQGIVLSTDDKTYYAHTNIHKPRNTIKLNPGASYLAYNKYNEYRISRTPKDIIPYKRLSLDSLKTDTRRRTRSFRRIMRSKSFSQKLRKAPRLKAKQFKPNSIQLGLDGKMWIALKIKGKEKNLIKWIRVK